MLFGDRGWTLKDDGVVPEDVVEQVLVGLEVLVLSGGGDFVRSVLSRGFSREVLALFDLKRNDTSPGRPSLIYSKGGRNLKTFKGDRGWTLEDDGVVLEVAVEQVSVGVADEEVQLGRPGGDVGLESRWLVQFFLSCQERGIPDLVAFVIVKTTRTVEQLSRL